MSFEVEPEIKEELSVDESNENSEPEETASEDETSMLRDKIAELEDGKLRMAAEMQNTRKRLEKQRLEDYKYRHQDILRDMIEVIDNFERAIISSEETDDFQNFRAGIDLIEKQFTSMLKEKYNLDRFGEIGEPFNPACHEAIAAEESKDVDMDKIKQVLQSGYQLHDRVLRSAKVAVVKPLQVKENSENDNDDNI